MQITLYGGPHDGRRITIDPAVARTRLLQVFDEVHEEFLATEDLSPIGPAPTASLYKAERWADGPTTGPDSRHTRFWDRWQYAGPA